MKLGPGVQIHKKEINVFLQVKKSTKLIFPKDLYGEWNIMYHGLAYIGCLMS